jgi:tetratricopeptide (TPR) repeat protein
MGTHAFRSTVALIALSLQACAGGNGSLPDPPPPPPPTVAVAAAPADDSSRPAAASPAGLSSLPAFDLSLSAVTDPRQSRIRQRAVALLVVEIQQLEYLLNASDAGSRDRPLILRRLAEDYVELESAASREATAAELQRDAARASDPREAARQQTLVDSRKTLVDRARKAAIDDYTRLVDQYSGQPSQTFPSSPPPAYPLIDEVVYFLGYEYQQAGDRTNARRVYLDLVTRMPNSKFVPNVYVAFGDLFFVEAMSDSSRWDLARGAYVKATDAPPPDNKVYGYAWYKLAYVFWEQGDATHAFDALQRAIDFGTEYAQLPNAAKVADSARVSLARLRQGAP